MNIVPTPRQITWQELEFIAFAHFGINTFTDREWGKGTEAPSIFNPTEFDADQWARVLEDAGIRLLILTAKHHDGFCLWPSRYTEHCVKNSPWRNGRGDVVREVSDACRRHGIKFGVYLSPWDRNNPNYGNSPVYNQYFVNQLRELLGNYGEISEVWFDGACGEGPNGKRQVYDWAAYYRVVRKLQPKAVIAICGPDVRWVGNESGVARETEWSVQPANRTFHGKDKDLVWWPAECDVSIRPGWFYHAAQDDNVKSLKQLLDIYYKSVGRNSVLLLNIPPDRRGLFHENDVGRLRELRNVLDRTFRTDLAAGVRASANSAANAHPADAAVDGRNATWWEPAGDDLPATLDLDLGEPRTFNCILLQEYIPKGQRVEAFSVLVATADGWRELAAGTTIGHKRLMPVKPDVTAAKVRIEIRKSRGAPLLRRIGLFKAPMLP
ncbi:MAG: alpha-L-fucosidase [Kiritimatiellaeota bacterium]|nr:alpha-L-fucosidase [Kiritimatiellota bacterium]